MFNRGAYTTIGDVCKKKYIFSPFEWCQLSFTHIQALNMRYSTRVPVGSIESAFCNVLSTLNKRAYARCGMYAHCCLE